MFINVYASHLDAEGDRIQNFVPFIYNVRSNKNIISTNLIF